MPEKRDKRLPSPDTVSLEKQIRLALATKCENGRQVGSAKFGVYAFYDFDGEPIYVGQTREKLGGRIRRHLTNQRTDAVAMNVLDPFEVAEIEMWPFWDLEGLDAGKAATPLNRAEFTVFSQLVDKSSFKAILNEKDIQVVAKIGLPKSYRVKIVPNELWDARNHADVRIARRAGTIADLAKVINERKVSPGLRRTLQTQAKRLETLASTRLLDFATVEMPIEHGEE